MITILPESEGNLLAVRATGKLTSGDYEEVFIPVLKEMIAEHGTIRALLHLDEEFEGWEMGAMWDDAKFGMRQHANDFDKLAVVGGPTYVEWTVKVADCFTLGQVRSFEGAQYQEALDWVNA